MNLVDWFSKPERLKSESSCGFHWKCRLPCGHRYCASGLNEDFSLGPVDGSSFSLHRNPLGNPSSTQAQTHSKRKVFRRLLPVFTVNPGEGVLCQLMPDSLWNGDGTEKKC